MLIMGLNGTDSIFEINEAILFSDSILHFRLWYTVGLIVRKNIINR